MDDVTRLDEVITLDGETLLVSPILDPTEELTIAELEGSRDDASTRDDDLKPDELNGEELDGA